MFQTLAVLATLAAVRVDAHMMRSCGGDFVDVAENWGGRMMEKRQNTWQSEEQLAPDQACTGYDYAGLDAVKANYPTVWQPATIVPGDTVAQNLFAQINATLAADFSNTPVRTGFDGTFTNITYASADPDCWWSYSHCTMPASSTGLQDDIITVPEPDTWGYGFDDGPNCSHNAFYDFLLQQNQKATMFYIGSNVYNWPLQAIRAVEDGHHICVHTWSHHYMTNFTNDVAFAELYYTRKLIKDILGVTPKCWRPPMGDVDNRIRAIAAGLNLTTVVWDGDSSDWRVNATGSLSAVTPAQVDQNYEWFIGNETSGAYSTYGPVILTHELNNYTMQEAMNFYPQIKAAFKHVVPIAVAYNWTTPYAETNITFPNFVEYIAGLTNDTGSQNPSSLTTSGMGPSVSALSASGSGKPASTTVGSGSTPTTSGSATTSKSSAGKRFEGAGVFAAVLGALMALCL